MAVLEYLEYLKIIKKRSFSTLKQYKFILREFQRFEPITRRSWKRYLIHISKNSVRTQRLKLTVVKNYLNYRADRGEIREKERFWNEAQLPKENSLPKALTKTQLKRLLNVVDNSYYKNLFRIIANTGMRISEALNLTEEDITFEKEIAILRIRGKGNKERVISVPKKIVQEALKAGVFKRKITPQAVEKMIKKYAKKANLKRVTPHTLRHTFAVLMIEMGKSINEVQALLGHSSISTTGIYLKVASEAIKVPEIV